MRSSSGGYADAVIVAAGSSSRMGGLDKTGASVAGRPVLRWAIDAMRGAHSVRRIIVVASAERVASLQSLDWVREAGIRVMAGGPRRQDSVACGVRAADASVILVHDAARPLASAGLVDRVAEAAEEHGAAIPVLPVIDSLKSVSDGVVSGVADRGGLFRAQTPQGAHRDLLMAAIDAFADGPELFGDEQELLARGGVPVVTVPGEPGAMKITEPLDLDIIRAIARDELPVRYAWGTDSHPFGARDGLRLAGLDVPEAPMLHGHSDGDAALHAVCDGLLAAARLGDLGRLFPGGDPRTQGIDSRELTRQVVARLGEVGWRPASLDLTIIGARPRLGGHRLDSMVTILAGLLGLDRAGVAVQASTGNLSGDEGAGRTITATALVGVVAP